MSPPTPTPARPARPSLQRRPPRTSAHRAAASAVGYPPSMRSWPSRLLVIGTVVFLFGWGLVLASGHGGNSTGGSELVWRIGGLMVYVSIPALLVAALVSLVQRLRRGMHLGSH